MQGFNKVCESDGAEGYDGVSIDEFNENLESNINSLHYELTYNYYKPKPATLFEKKKSTGKIRRLFIYSVRDRVVQASTMQTLTPLFEAELEKESFAFRKGFSRESAARRIYSLYNDGYIWALDADISNFFDKVNHQILFERFREIINEDRVINLISKWVKTEYIFNDKRFKVKEGLPQGSVISPMLANLYLDKFDESIKERGFKLVRYADDFLILTKTKPEAEKALYLTADLLKEYELQLNFEKTKIADFKTGFKFLGYIFLNSLIVPSAHKDTSQPIPINQTDEVVNKLKARFNRHKASGIRINQSTEEKLRSSVAGEAFLKAIEQKGITLESFLNQLEQKQQTQIALNPIKAEAEIEAEFIEDEITDVDEKTDIAEVPAPSALVSTFGRTLYIQEQGSILMKEGERIVVEKSGTELLNLPSLKINQVIIIGNCTITPAAMQFLLRKAVPIILLSSRGKYYGRIESTVVNNAEAERLQIIRSLDDNLTLHFSKQVVQAKLHNSKVFLQRHSKLKANDTITLAIEILNKYTRMAERSISIDNLRGVEGNAASAYFKAFGTLFKTDTGFYNESFLRTKRPPLDPVNSLLSFGYTLFHSNILSILRAHGLNPYIGFYHQLRAGHPALASDLLEEFRCVIDSMVVNIINHRILTSKDFYYAKEPSTPCYLSSNARKAFIRQFEIKMNTRLLHPQTKLKADYRRCIDLQVQHLLKVIRGEEDLYIPFTIKL
jgi:CRISPR-associated protein Cas1